MIGVFDSGLGGLSVLTELVRLLPDADLEYFADSGRAPYGPRPLREVRSFSEQITRHLLDAGAGMVVIACNAASAAALHHLRREHPAIPFVGMEPAVKPAAAATATGVVGVLTTAATFQGELFASVVDRHAANTRIVTSICDGWVELVEAGRLDGPDVERAVARYVGPLLEEGVDTLVLGCTHYPFLAPVVSRLAGPGVTIIDPAPAVARQAARVATELGIAGGAGNVMLSTTGSPDELVRLVKRLTGLALSVRAVTFSLL